MIRRYKSWHIYREKKDRKSKILFPSFANNFAREKKWINLAKKEKSGSNKTRGETDINIHIRRPSPPLELRFIEIGCGCPPTLNSSSSSSLPLKFIKTKGRRVNANKFWNENRLRKETAGGAWCPKSQIERGIREWLQVDLPGPHVITGVQSQGRYDHGRGQEYVEEYTLEYRRPGFAEWRRYKRWDNKEVRGHLKIKRRSRWSSQRLLLIVEKVIKLKI